MGISSAMRLVGSERPPPAGPALVDGPGAGPFEAFYAEWWDWAVRVAALILQDDDVAREVAQDAMIALYHRWDGLEQPRAYLRRTLVNRCHNWKRRQRVRRDKVHLVSVPDRTDLGATELTDAIAALPLRQRTVVVLRYYCDLSEAEIAHAVGCRPGTVKSLSSRALARLRKEISR